MSVVLKFDGIQLRNVDDCFSGLVMSIVFINDRVYTAQPISDH